MPPGRTCLVTLRDNVALEAGRDDESRLSTDQSAVHKPSAAKSLSWSWVTAPSGGRKNLTGATGLLLPSAASSARIVSTLVLTGTSCSLIARAGSLPYIL